MATTDKGTQLMEGLLLSQYANSPNLKEYINAYVSEMDLLFENIEEVYLGRFIENAVGAQLDVIGKILDEDRALNLPTQFFGFMEEGGSIPSNTDQFADEAAPSEGGIFKDESQVGSASYTLSDAEYRRLLLAKALVTNRREVGSDNTYSVISTLLGRTPSPMRLLTSGTIESNRVSNGDFTDGTEGWSRINAGDLSVENGVMRATSNGEAATFTQTIETDIGESGKVTFSAVETSGANFKVIVDGAVVYDSSAIGIQVAYFTPTATTTFLEFQTGSVTAGEYTEWGFVLAEDVSGDEIDEANGAALTAAPVQVVDLDANNLSGDWTLSGGARLITPADLPDENYLWLNGVDNSAALTTGAVTNVLGDFKLKMVLEFDSVPNVGNTYPLSMLGISHRCWDIYTPLSGHIKFRYALASDGDGITVYTASTISSIASYGVVAGQKFELGINRYAETGLVEFYIDDVLVSSSSTNSGNLYEGTSKLKVGGNLATGSANFQGKVYEANVFDGIEWVALEGDYIQNSIKTRDLVPTGYQAMSGKRNVINLVPNSSMQYPVYATGAPESWGTGNDSGGGAVVTTAPSKYYYGENAVRFDASSDRRFFYVSVRVVLGRKYAVSVMFEDITTATSFQVVSWNNGMVDGSKGNLVPALATVGKRLVSAIGEASATGFAKLRVGMGVPNFDGGDFTISGLMVHDVTDLPVDDYSVEYVPSMTPILGSTVGTNPNFTVAPDYELDGISFPNGYSTYNRQNITSTVSNTDAGTFEWTTNAHLGGISMGIIPYKSWVEVIVSYRRRDDRVSGGILRMYTNQWTTVDHPEDVQDQWYTKKFKVFVNKSGSNSLILSRLNGVGDATYEVRTLSIKVLSDSDGDSNNPFFNKNLNPTPDAYGLYYPLGWSAYSAQNIVSESNDASGDTYSWVSDDHLAGISFSNLTVGNDYKITIKYRCNSVKGAVTLNAYDGNNGGWQRVDSDDDVQGQWYTKVIWVTNLFSINFFISRFTTDSNRLVEWELDTVLHEDLGPTQNHLGFEQFNIENTITSVSGVDTDVKELIDDPYFTLGSGWTISGTGAAATGDGQLVFTDGVYNLDYAWQNISVVAGKWYRATLAVDRVDEGGVYAYINGQYTLFNNKSEVGVYTIDWYCTATNDHSIRVSGHFGGNSKVGSFSFKEITYLNPEGELLVNEFLASSATTPTGDIVSSTGETYEIIGEAKIVRPVDKSTSNYIEFPTSSSLVSRPYTEADNVVVDLRVELWIRPNSSTFGGTNRLLHRRVNGGCPYDFYISSDGKLGVYFDNLIGTVNGSAVHAPTADVDWHVAFERRASTGEVTFFTSADGISWASEVAGNNPIPMISSGSTVDVQGGQLNGSARFEGKMIEAKVTDGLDYTVTEGLVRDFESRQILVPTDGLSTADSFDRTVTNEEPNSGMTAFHPETGTVTGWSNYIDLPSTTEVFASGLNAGENAKRHSTTSSRNFILKTYSVNVGDKVRFSFYCEEAIGLSGHPVCGLQGANIDGQYVMGDEIVAGRRYSTVVGTADETATITVRLGLGVFSGGVTGTSFAYSGLQFENLTQSANAYGTQQGIQVEKNSSVYLNSMAGSHNFSMAAGNETTEPIWNTDVAQANGTFYAELDNTIIIPSSNDWTIEFDWIREQSSAGNFVTFLGSPTSTECAITAYDKAHATLPDSLRVRTGLGQTDFTDVLSSVEYGDHVNIRIEHDTGTRVYIDGNLKEDLAVDHNRLAIGMIYNGLSQTVMGAGNAMQNLVIEDTTDGYRWEYLMDEGSGTDFINTEVATQGNFQDLPLFRGEPIIAANDSSHVIIPKITAASSDDFELEMDILKGTPIGGRVSLLGLADQGDWNNYMFMYDVLGAFPNALQFSFFGGFVVFDAFNDVADNSTCTLKMSRVSGVITVYVNGIQKGITYANANEVNIDQLMRTGANDETMVSGNGLSNFRFTNLTTGKYVQYLLDEGAGDVVQDHLTKELVTNGRNLNNADGWTTLNSELRATDEGYLAILNTLAGGGRARQQFGDIEVGKRYKLEVTTYVNGSQGASLRLSTGTGGNDYATIQRLELGYNSLDFTATGTTLWCDFVNYWGSTEEAFLGNISVREIPDSIDYATPGIELTRYTNLNGATTSNAVGTLRLTSQATNYGATQISAPNLVVGQQYAFDFSVISNTAQCSVSVAGGVVIAPTAFRATGDYTGYFIATATSHVINLLVNGGVGAYVDYHNLRLHEIVDGEYEGGWAFDDDINDIETSSNGWSWGASSTPAVVEYGIADPLGGTNALRFTVDSARHIIQRTIGSTPELDAKAVHGVWIRKIVDSGNDAGTSFRPADGDYSNVINPTGDWQFFETPSRFRLNGNTYFVLDMNLQTIGDVYEIALPVVKVQYSGDIVNSAGWDTLPSYSNSGSWTAEPWASAGWPTPRATISSTVDGSYGTLVGSITDRTNMDIVLSSPSRIQIASSGTGLVDVDYLNLNGRSNELPSEYVPRGTPTEVLKSPVWGPDDWVIENDPSGELLKWESGVLKVDIIDNNIYFVRVSEGAWSLDANKTYVFEYTVENWVSGGCHGFYINDKGYTGTGFTPSTPNYNISFLYTAEEVSNPSNAKLVFAGANIKFDITNFTIKEATTGFEVFSYENGNTMSGHELITNGDFSEGTDDWTVGEISEVSGELRIDSNEGSEGNALYTFSTLPSTTIELGFDAVAGNSNFVVYADGVKVYDSAVIGSQTQTFTTTGYLTEIMLVTGSTALGSYTVWDNIVATQQNSISPRNIELELSRQDTSVADDALITYFGKYLAPLGTGFTVTRK